MVGLLNLHKPPNLTSRRAVDVVSRAARTKRVGHAGTLDPMASGVLLICIGWATRLTTYLQDRPKSYSARFLLGRRSNTDDVTGEMTESLDVAIPNRGQVEWALQSFVGRISQVPPQFSAVHVAGERAYKAAREGRQVDIEPRIVEVHRIELREYAYPELALEIDCGSGTYIRSIGRDLGELLGCGAVMSSLVRTAIGEFHLDQAMTLESIENRPHELQSQLFPPLTAVAGMAHFAASADQCTALLQGKGVLLSQLEGNVGDEIAVVNPAGNLFALAELAANPFRLQPRQVFVDSK